MDLEWIIQCRITHNIKRKQLNKVSKQRGRRPHGYDAAIKRQAANAEAKEKRKDDANNLKQRIGLSCAGLSKKEETYYFFKGSKLLHHLKYE